MTATIQNELDFCPVIGLSFYCDHKYVGGSACGSVSLSIENKTKKNINKEFDYFGGIVMTNYNADNCPIAEIYEGHSCIFNSKKDDLVNKYGKKSRCIVGNYGDKKYMAYSNRDYSRCVESTCTKDD